MKEGTPLDIRSMMPNATVTQICDMCDLWENPGDLVKKPRSQHIRKSKMEEPIPRRSSNRRRRVKASSSRKTVRVKKSEPKNNDRKMKSDRMDQKAAFPVPTSTKEC